MVRWNDGNNLVMVYSGVVPMHAKIRLTASPPASPRVSLSPTKGPARYGRSRSGRFPGGLGPTLPPRSFLHSFACLLLSVLFRRQGVFLLAPLLYISGMLLYVGTVSFEVPGGRGTIALNRPRPGSIYRSPEVFQHLWPSMQKANSSFGIDAAWQHPKEEEYWFPCINHTKSFKGLQESSGFIVVEANGGLNQQRSSICNAVALAGLLNATLVIPQFHFNSVWQDPSVFGEIYDEDHFINTLSEEVRVVRQLPSYIMESFDNNISNIYNFRSKAWSPASYYLNTVLPRLLEVGVIRIAPFANRLSFDKMPPRIQQLRCFANFEALKFAQPIESTAKLLVDRMIEKSAATGGKYLSIHLRFEEDMVAFSCCVYDSTIEEKREMDFVRERSWRGKFNRTGRIIKPQAIRMDGRCPLTPLEVGMMLRGMGFQSTTPIYLASGKIYKAEKNMAPLRQMFPFLETKETLLSPDELAPFQKFSSRMAALDYTVCLQSEVFVTSQGGNFPQFLMGHRRYLNRGHAKTIKPDKRKLALLLDNPGIRWETFTKEMQWMRRESDAKGHELRKPTASIYITPAPDCMCPFDKSHHTSADLEFKLDSNTTAS